MTSGPTGADRRGSVRTHLAGALTGDIELQVGSDVLFLSSSGMMMRLEFAPELGTRHRFTLEVEGRTIELEGIVRNVAPDGVRTKVGVEFENVSEEDHAFLEKFVARKLEDPTPE